MSTEDRHLSRGVLLVGIVVVLAAWVQAASLTTGSKTFYDQVFFDNIHWTVSYLVAAILVTLAVQRGGGAVQRARWYFMVGVILLAIGQIIYDIQVTYDWLPFPGPSDFFFIPLGGFFMCGFAVILRESLPAARQRLVVFDVCGFSLAVLALVLTLYLPHGGKSSIAELVTLTTYPVVLLSAAATALLMQLHLRQRWTMHWQALFLGLCGHGAAWMIWNLETLSNTLGSGTLVNLAFSACTLLLGWGAAGWRPQADTSASFDRLCEGALRQLPLAMVALTSAAIGLLVLDQSLDQTTRNVLLVLGMTVLLFAVVRQTQQLGERDRLIEAERVVAESQAQLQHLAHHDPLTGLPNLTLLRDRVQQALLTSERKGLRTALLFVDLDQFKEINDTLGHATGDALLCHVARQIEAQLRGSDTVSRQGGDEFTIVLPEVASIDAVAEVAEKVMAISGSSAQLQGHELPMSLSVGIALYPDDAHDFNTLLQCADTAMYRAKAAGRNGYRFYDSHMNAEANERIQMRARLSHAIERHELLLHYQPQIDLATGAVCGAEALLRWNSPELGPIAPAAFIPVAEDSGLIVEIGGWVLQEACRQAALWQGKGLPALRLAVNISMLQFRRGNLEHQVVEALRNSGYPPHLLELEVTESVLIQDVERVIATVGRLGDLGVHFAIDDFGTGYSSLSYLRRLRVGKLKVDRSFVNDAMNDAGSAAIVRAMIDMARALRLVTVAEGVETQEQLDFLRECRCDIGQGYWFTRPLDPRAFEQYLIEHR